MTLEHVGHAWCWLSYSLRIIPDHCDGFTHLLRDKMAVISQTTFSNAFSCMKKFEFWLKFHWSLFLRVQLTITKHWFKWWHDGLVLNRWQAIIWTNADLLLWRLYVGLGGDELMQKIRNSRGLAMELCHFCIKPLINALELHLQSYQLYPVSNKSYPIYYHT